MIKKDKTMNINVFDGDDGIKYIRYNDFEKMFDRIKQVHDEIEKEKDDEIEKLKQNIELLQNDLDNANSKLKDYLRRNIRAINLIENMLLRFDTFSALEVKTIKYVLEGDDKE